MDAQSAVESIYIFIDIFGVWTSLAALMWYIFSETRIEVHETVKEHQTTGGTFKRNKGETSSVYFWHFKL